MLNFVIFDLSVDEDESEDVGGGNRLLGFMFGNVDGAGDLDVDYLDEVVFCILSGITWPNIFTWTHIHANDHMYADILRGCIA